MTTDRSTEAQRAKLDTPPHNAVMLRPWSATKPDQHGNCYVIDANGYRMVGPLCPAERAALIIRAVNAHDELVAALENMIRAFARPEHPMAAERRADAMTDARTALARARGDPPTPSGLRRAGG